MYYWRRAVVQLDPLGAVAVVGAAVGLMPGGVVLGRALSRGAGGFHFLRPGRGIRTRRTWPERPAAGAICFVGRCTGSRWAYAVPRRGGCHCVAMGARCCDRCRGRVMLLLPMSARRIVAAGLAPAARDRVGLAGQDT